MKVSEFFSSLLSHLVIAISIKVRMFDKATESQRGEVR